MAETNAISQGEYFNQLRELNRRITYLSQQMRNTDLQPLDVIIAYPLDSIVVKLFGGYHLV